MRIGPSCTCKSLTIPNTLALRAAPPTPSRSPIRAFQSSSTFSTHNSDSPSTKGKEKERWPGWQPVIGLELHVQLKGNLKLLSSARAVYDDDPNTHIATFDAALPGSLPRLGSEPVRLALLASLALNSNINPASTFDRKHYFYPDLPSGFQVTQKYAPLAKGGSMKVRRSGKNEDGHVVVGIDQIQLEQDTAKSSHDPDTGLTLVDLNRAGAALIEIVTKPDMRSPEDAAGFVRNLQAILRHTGVSDANMDRGELRCDVNVSVQRTEPGSPFGTRCEVKNLNGVRFLAQAIESEIKRQIADLEAGKPIVQATRGFDAVTGETFHLRGKEDAPDYRYMPDPELGPILVTQAQLAKLRGELPELPEDAFDRLRAQYGLSGREAGILVALGERMDDGPEGEDGAEGTTGMGVRWFEEVAKGREAKVAANWFIHELLGQLSKAGLSLPESPLSPQGLGQVIDAVVAGTLTGTSAKSLLRTFLASPSPSPQLLDELLASHQTPATSTDELEGLCKAVVEAMPKEAEKVRQGQGKVVMRLVGEVMKRSGGKVDARKAGDVLRTILGV